MPSPLKKPWLLSLELPHLEGLNDDSDTGSTDDEALKAVEKNLHVLRALQGSGQKL